ncbi:hypothetical protein Tco_0758344 [Tanacetum coccineum]
MENGIDWTTHSEDNDNYAFTANNSNRIRHSGTFLSISAKNPYANIKRLYDIQKEQLSDASVEIKAYTQGLKKVEAQLVVHQQNQLWYEQKIKFMKIDLDDKTDVLTYHKTLLAKAQKEKDDLDVIVHYGIILQKNLNSQVEVHPTVWSDAPIIEEYESDSDDDDENVYVKIEDLDTPSFATKHVKTPSENVKNNSTHSQKPKVNNKQLEKGITERACFVCGSLGIIREYLRKPNNGDHAQRVTNTFILSLWHHKHELTDPVNTLKRANMTGNKAYLADYQDINGGPVAFGGSRGYITGKGKIQTVYCLMARRLLAQNGCIGLKDEREWLSGTKLDISISRSNGWCKSGHSSMARMMKKYMCTTTMFPDPSLPQKVYKVVKALLDYIKLQELVCACSRFQVTPKTSHLTAVKRIFRKIHNRRFSISWQKTIITWQCKKQTIVATTTTEAEYVAAASCCGQVLWIQNQMSVVSTTFVEQFWTSAKSKTINNARHITAKVAGKLVSISEASIRTDLLFDDADGIDTLPNQAIFDAIQLMGYEGDLTVLTFNKALFSPQWSEVPFEQQPDLSPSPSPRPSPNPSPTPNIPDSIPEHTDQAEIKLLKAKITKLKKKANPVIKHFKAYQKRISKEQRQQRKRLSKKKKVQIESDKKQLMDEDKETDEVGLSTEDEVSTAKEGVNTDFEKVSTDRPKLSTDDFKVSTDDQVDASEDIFKGTEDKGEGSEERVESTTEQRVTFLINMSKAKAISKEKEKGVELKDVEDTDRPRTTSTRSTLTLKPLPKIDPKDKGKKKIEEEDETESEDDDIPQAVKKFKQLESDEELAGKCKKNGKLKRRKTNLILAEKLQEQEREQFTIEERAKFLHDTIAAQRKFLAQQDHKLRRINLQPKNQRRNQMKTYISSGTTNYAD